METQSIMRPVGILLVVVCCCWPLVGGLVGLIVGPYLKGRVVPVDEEEG